MTSTAAQKRASARYIEKRKAEGFNQHLIYATPIQWMIILELVRAVKKMNLEGIQSMEIDDDGKYIRFIYQNEPETRVVSPNIGQDDKS